MQHTTANDHDMFSGAAAACERKADELDGLNGAASQGSTPKPGRYFQFGSKVVYTACYTLSYGVCFPIFMACRYIPKNNELVNGLVDGGASANHAVDEMMDRAEQWRLARREASERAAQESACVDSGVEVLAST